MTDADYTRICQACGEEYKPTINLDGSLRKTKYSICGSSRCRSAVYPRKPRKTKSYRRSCSHCDAEFIGTQVSAKYCGEQCRIKARRQRKKSSEVCVVSRRAREALRRARKSTGTAERIAPDKVFERDGWICHICGVKTLREKRGTLHPLAPELEHIVSLADGGTHTWCNVACACLRCNRTKGASSFGQLRLPWAA